MCLRTGQRQQLVVDLVVAQGGEAHVVLGLLTHAREGVGIDHVGAGHGLVQVARELDRRPGLGGVGPRPGDDRLVGPVVLGRADHDPHAGLGADLGQRVGHVVAVARVDQLATLESAAVLLDGERVGHRLTGMMVVGQTADDGDGGAGRQVDHVGLGVGADHDRVEVAAEHVAGVSHGLADAQLDVVGVQIERLGAELGDADLERDARAGRGLGEDHADGLAGQQRMRLGTLLGHLELAGQLDQPPDLGRREVVDGEKVAAGEAQVGDAVLQRGHVASFGARGWSAGGGRRLRRPTPPARSGDAIK